MPGFNFGDLDRGGKIRITFAKNQTKNLFVKVYVNLARVMDLILGRVDPHRITQHCEGCRNNIIGALLLHDREKQHGERITKDTIAILRKQHRAFAVEVGKSWQNICRRNQNEEKKIIHSFTGLGSLFTLASGRGYLYFLVSAHYFVKQDFHSSLHYYFPIRYETILQKKVQRIVSAS